MSVEAAAWGQGVSHDINRDVSDQIKNLQGYYWNVFNALFTLVF